MKCNLLIIIFLSFLCSNSYADTDRWKLLKEDELVAYTIDRSTIVKFGNNNIHFWVKLTRKDYLIYRDKRVRYYLYNYDINCKNRMFKELDEFVFTDNNCIIDRIQSQEPKENKIIPETIMELYYNYLCK